MLAVMPDEAGHLVGGGHHGEGVRDRQPPLPHPRVGLALRRELGPLDGAHAVHQHPQRARRADRRVLLPQRPGRRVARVRERRLARRHQGLVQLLEARHGEEHLAAHLQVRGRVSGQAVRDPVDAGHVGCDVLAHPAVAAGGRDAEPPVEVEQVDGQPVDLQLAQVALGGGAGQPGGELVVGEHVVQAQHPTAVLDGLEVRDPRGAYPLRDRVGVHQGGMLGLQRLELAHRRVVVGVREGGSRGAVVGLLRVGQELVELRPAPPQVRRRHPRFGLDVLAHAPMVPHR